MILAIDTETNGTDFFHGCKPFMFTACDGIREYLYSGVVNPHTRNVHWEPSVIQAIKHLISLYPQVVFHNANFDKRALHSIGITQFPLIQDTLVASHCLSSGDSHKLKDLGIKLFDYWNDDEFQLDQSIISIRAGITQRNLSLHPTHPDFVRIAKRGDPCFPGVTNAKWHKMDMWLDMILCAKYAIQDAERTWLIWQACESALLEQNLYSQYIFRRNLLPILYDMQSVGINIYMNKVDRLIDHLKFQLEGLRLYIESTSGFQGRFNPRSKKDLDRLLVKTLGIDMPLTPTGKVSTGKETLKIVQYIESATASASNSSDSRTSQTLAYLQQWAVVEKELSSIVSYKEWSLLDHDNPFFSAPPHHPTPSPESACAVSVASTYNSRLHSSLNLTGTHWTRQSSSDPNQQNFKKSLSYLWGPPPGYYWLYHDVRGIEIWILTYDIGKKEWIECFERGESPHVEIAQAIRPEQIAQAGGLVKWRQTDKYHKQYTKTKGGTFAYIYGGSEDKVNKTYGLPNAYYLIETRLPELKEYRTRLRQEMLASSDPTNPLFSYYPTIRTMAPVSYRLDIPTSSPHTLASGRIQGTAGIIIQAMMQEIPKFPLYSSLGCQLIQQVHDSLTIEIPIHPNASTTNILLTRELERIGSTHIPNCGMDSEVILPSPHEPFRLDIYTKLPESYTSHSGDSYTLTYQFQDGIGWICLCVSSSGYTTEHIGSTYEQARQTAIENTL